MGHLIDRCDFVDVLEESVTTGGAVAVELIGGTRFIDRVRDVYTMDGVDYAEFKDHATVAVPDILAITRAQPFVPSYAGKT
jgi:Rho-binding antiterminator